MPFIKNIPRWLGITAPKWLHQAIARRNMPIMGVLAASAIVFAAMLLFYLLTRTPSNLDGFDAVAYASDHATLVFTVAATATIVIMLAIIVFAIVYLRKNLVRPGIATAVTFAFAYVLVMLWVLACSGQDPQRQIMFFASMQFLVAGLIVFNPMVSAVYFVLTYFRFGYMLYAGGLLAGKMGSDLAYLAFICLLVNIVMYGLFARVNEREHEIVALSQRDELTGAKNRHALRADFTSYNGAEFERKVKKVAEQLKQIDIGDEARSLTYSGGYMRGKVSNNDEFRLMLHKADENLMAAKRRGKNQLVGERFE